MVEIAHSDPGYGKASAEDMELVNDRSDTTETVMDAVIKDEEHLEWQRQAEVNAKGTVQQGAVGAKWCLCACRLCQGDSENS